MESVFGVILCLAMIVISALTIGILIGRTMMGIRIGVSRAVAKGEAAVPPKRINKSLEEVLYKADEVDVPPFMEEDYGKKTTA